VDGGGNQPRSGSETAKNIGATLPGRLAGELATSASDLAAPLLLLLILVGVLYPRPGVFIHQDA